MSTKTHIVAPVMLGTVAAVMSIVLAPSASALRQSCGGNTFGGGPNTAAMIARGGGGCNPFERIENGFDRIFHIPDRDDQVRLQQKRAN
jgi:hypothetical protein